MSAVNVDIGIVPRLVVCDVDDAIKLYQSVFDAETVERFVDQSGQVVHAQLVIGQSSLSLTPAVPEWHLDDPISITGSPVLLRLYVPNPDELASKLVSSGGEVIIEIRDRPYGFREGRVRDKFGHLWILSKPIG